MKRSAPGDWTAPGTRQSSLFSWCLFECQRSKLTCFVCVYMCCRFSDDLSEASAVRYSVCAAHSVNLFSRLCQVHRDLTWRKSKQKTCSVGTLCSTWVRQHVLDTQGKSVLVDENWLQSYWRSVVIKKTKLEILTGFSSLAYKCKSASLGFRLLMIKQEIWR